MSLLNKMKQYVEGNFNMIQDHLIGKPQYYKEQIAYRASKCKDCYKIGRCKECGCNLPGKHYVEQSCNDGKRFPDLMNESDWEKYKEENNINIDE